jgi:hypothetical protein
MDIFAFSRAARPISVDNASLRRDLDKALYKSQRAVATRWLHELFHFAGSYTKLMARNSFPRLRLRLRLPCPAGRSSKGNLFPSTERLKRSQNASSFALASTRHTTGLAHDKHSSKDLDRI